MVAIPQMPPMQGAQTTRQTPVAPPPPVNINSVVTPVIPPTPQPQSKLKELLKNKAQASIENPQRLNTVMKYLTMTLITLFVVGLISFKAVLHEKNAYLGIFQISDNTKSLNIKLEEEKTNETIKQATLKGEIARTQKQIEDKNFFIHSDIIGGIQKQQRNWSDSINEGEFQFGLLDLTTHLQNYINKGHQEHKILQNANSITIKNFNIDREKANFTIHASNFLGNVFLLSSEITEIINGLPEFKNGKIMNYSRVKEKNGQHSMSFTLSVEVQTSEDKDPKDRQASSMKFQEWIQNNNGLQASSEEF